MKRLFAFVSCAVFLFIAGCDSGSDAAKALSCSLQAGPETLTVASTIDYDVTLTGDGSVTSISYRSGGEQQTVSNPTLPWSVTANAGAEEIVTLTATGSVRDGRINVKLEAEGSQGGTQISITRTDSCEQSS